MPRGHVFANCELMAALRGEAGLTQDELASRAGYGLRTIGKIERGGPTTSFTLSAIATVLSDCLGRPIEVVDLLQANGDLPRSPFEASTFIVGEHVKLLELRSPSAPGKRLAAVDMPPRAVLFDTICLRYIPAGKSEINLHYAVNGGVLDGESLSHADQAEWLESKCDGSGSAERGRLDVGPVLNIRLPATGGRRQLIQNRVKYVGAFSKLGQRWFQTDVVYPTDSLTLLVRFPEGQPFSSLRGLCRRQFPGPLLPTADQPLGIACGQLAYWRIAGPVPGESYQLGWA